MNTNSLNKTKMKKLLVLFLIAFVQISCGQNNSNTITPENFKDEIVKPDVILLDVRTPEEFAESHLENAVNIDYHNENFSSRIDELDKTKKYEVYCRSGKRSAATVKVMQEKGIANVHDLQGGILKWQEKGFPVTK